VCTEAKRCIFSFCLDSLEVIRSINDQTCPYLKYAPIENKGNKIDDIVVDDRPHAQRTYKDDSISCNYRGFFYEFKPYT
jgi:hypothetical protein